MTSITLYDAQTGRPVVCQICGLPAQALVQVLHAANMPVLYRPVCDEHNPFLMQVSSTMVHPADVVAVLKQQIAELEEALRRAGLDVP